MQMMLLRAHTRRNAMLRKVRKANITPELRTHFERYGENVLVQVLVNNPQTQDKELVGLLAHRQEIMDWLTERRDIHERREQRLEAVEWAILIWVVIGVIADIIIVTRS
jgi:hypothetical protein